MASSSDRMTLHERIVQSDRNRVAIRDSHKASYPIHASDALFYSYKDASHIPAEGQRRLGYSDDTNRPRRISTDPNPFLLGRKIDDAAEKYIFDGIKHNLPWRKNLHGAYTDIKRAQQPVVFRPYGPSTHKTVKGTSLKVGISEGGFDATLVQSHKVSPFIPPGSKLAQQGSEQVLSHVPKLRSLDIKHILAD